MHLNLIFRLPQQIIKINTSFCTRYKQHCRYKDTPSCLRHALLSRMTEATVARLGRGLILYLLNIQSKHQRLYSEDDSCGSPMTGPWGRGGATSHAQSLNTHSYKSKTNTAGGAEWVGGWLGESLLGAAAPTNLTLFYRWMSFVTALAEGKAAGGREQAACWEWMERNVYVSHRVKEGGRERSEERSTSKCELGGMRHARGAGPAAAVGTLTWMRIFPKQTDGVLSSAMNMIPWK